MLHGTPGEVDPSSSRAIQVLVVEDNAELRSALEEIFTLEGFACEVTDNGAWAGEMVKLKKYDVVVSDIRMPGLDGIELTRCIQSLPTPPRIILMTAYPDWHVRSQGFRRADVFDLLEKPIDLAQLVQRVREAGLAY